MRKYKILLVDDDPFILRGTGKNLENRGYEVVQAENGEQAVELLERSTFDLVITDLVMDSIDGIGVLEKAKSVNPETMVIILTGFGDMTSAVEALRHDADDYLLKPCDADEIHFRMSRCLEKMELQKKLKFYEDMIPVCCVCKKIRDDVGKQPGEGDWMDMEKFMYKKARLKSSHTYCPECSKKVLKEWNL